jgi:hypothetical protein
VATFTVTTVPLCVVSVNVLAPIDFTVTPECRGHQSNRTGDSKSKLRVCDRGTRCVRALCRKLLLLCVRYTEGTQIRHGIRIFERRWTNEPLSSCSLLEAAALRSGVGDAVIADGRWLP